MKYFPFENDYNYMTMNAKAMTSPLIEVDEKNFADEIALKERILESNYEAYFNSPPCYNPVVMEIILYVLNSMSADYPQWFHLEVNLHSVVWMNKLLGTITSFSSNDCSSLPLPPLDWLGRQVQEDLILMMEDETGESICVAGHLCFGSGWSLRDKLGQSFLEAHAIVPEFHEQIGGVSDQLMRRLKPKRPVARLNWSVPPTNQLNLSPDLRSEWTPKEGEITTENAGDRCFLRIERQTISRMASSRAILFTIHTYLTPISEITQDSEKLHRLAIVIAAMPAATRTYKAMDSYFHALEEYIRLRLR